MFKMLYSGKKKQRGWIKYGTTISPEMMEYLKAKKQESKEEGTDAINVVIDKALRRYSQTKAGMVKTPA